MEVIRSIKESLNTFIEDKRTKKSIVKISDKKYHSLSFEEKKEIFTELNECIADHFASFLEIMFNNEKDDKIWDVYLSDIDTVLVNGLHKNPYIYFKDLLITHLYVNFNEYQTHSIGNIIYEENYYQSQNALVFFNKDNIYLVEEVVDAIKKLLKDFPGDRRDELYNTLEFQMTDEAKEELNKAYVVVDNLYKFDIYQQFLNLCNTIKEMVVKPELSKKEAALLSIDEVLNEYISRNTYESLKKTNVSKSKHLQQFISYFFEEYKDEIKITMNNLNVILNGNKLKKSNIFMETLMQEIEKIEKKNPRLDKLISDEELENYRMETSNPNVTKLDIYFCERLSEIDECLDYNQVRLVNGVRWRDVYNERHEKFEFYKANQLIETFSNDSFFIKLVLKYIQTEDYHLLYDINERMNQLYFNSDFKINMNFDKSVVGLGETLETEGKYFLNSNNNSDKFALLTTLFHEYEHLVQYSETETDHKIYNERMLQRIKNNTKKTIFSNQYSYAQGELDGYINEKFYSLQPIEYDAEMFSEKLLKTIIKKTGLSLDIEYRKYFPSIIKGTRFINLDRYLDKIYNNYCEINLVDEYIEGEYENYKILEEKINLAKNKQDALNVIKLNQFQLMNIKLKLKIYNLIDKEILVERVDREIISVDNEKYDVSDMDEYQLLEIILKKSAMNKVKNKEISLREMKQYIANEAKKFKYEELNEYNWFLSYYYHRTFDKYFNDKEDTKKCKR